MRCAIDITIICLLLCGGLIYYSMRRFNWGLVLGTIGSLGLIGWLIFG